MNVLKVVQWTIGLVVGLLIAVVIYEGVVNGGFDGQINF